MYDIILAVAIFHTLSTLTLLVGCAVASLTGPLLRRETLHQPSVDQSELDADRILSAPVPAAAAAPAARPQVDIAAVA
jgi:hypothetical protein